MYFVLDLTGQLELSPKGYVNKTLIKVSALEAWTVVSEQQVNLYTSSRAPSPNTIFLLFLWDITSISFVLLDPPEDPREPAVHAGGAEV